MSAGSRVRSEPPNGACLQLLEGEAARDLLAPMGYLPGRLIDNLTRCTESQAFLCSGTVI